MLQNEKFSLWRVLTFIIGVGHGQNTLGEMCTEEREREWERKRDSELEEFKSFQFWILLLFIYSFRSSVTHLFTTQALSPSLSSFLASFHLLTHSSLDSLLYFNLATHSLSPSRRPPSLISSYQIMTTSPWFTHGLWIAIGLLCVNANNTFERSLFTYMEIKLQSACERGTKRVKKDKRK